MYTKNDIGKSVFFPSSVGLGRGLGQIQSIKKGYVRVNNQWFADWMISRA